MEVENAPLPGRGGRLSLSKVPSQECPRLARDDDSGCRRRDVGNEGRWERASFCTSESEVLPHIIVHAHRK